MHQSIEEVLKYEFGTACLWLFTEEQRKEFRNEEFYSKRAATCKKLFHEYRRSAKKRDIEFELSFFEFYDLLKKPCHYCGRIDKKVYSKFSKNSHRVVKNDFTFDLNGIDRFNPDKGYSTGNVVSCCSQCNYFKLDYTYDEFISQIARIFNHSVKR